MCAKLRTLPCAPADGTQRPSETALTPPGDQQRPALDGQADQRRGDERNRPVKAARAERRRRHPYPFPEQSCPGHSRGDPRRDRTRRPLHRKAHRAADPGRLERTAAALRLPDTVTPPQLATGEILPSFCVSGAAVARVCGRAGNRTEGGPGRGERGVSATTSYPQTIHLIIAKRANAGKKSSIPKQPGLFFFNDLSRYCGGILSLYTAAKPLYIFPSLTGFVDGFT